MKRTLITALCFIPLISGMDDDEEIERTINGTTYKGHILGEEEHANINFIGMQKDGDKTTIIAQARGTFYPFFNRTELFAQYSFYGRHDNSFYLEYQGPFIIESKHFNPSDFKDFEITIRAFELFRLYTSTHAKRTLSTENRSMSED